MPLNNPLRYRCPTCDAHVGERCVELETGDLMTSFHHSRQMAAVPRRLDRVHQTLEDKRKKV